MNSVQRLLRRQRPQAQPVRRLSRGEQLELRQPVPMHIRVR